MRIGQVNAPQAQAIEVTRAEDAENIGRNGLGNQRQRRSGAGEMGRSSWGFSRMSP